VRRGKRRRPQEYKHEEIRVNRRIRAREVRVIGADGEQVGVLATQDAFALAQQEGLDLVEVAPTARPPVCKIMDFGRYKYDEKKRVQETKRRQTVISVKEVKIRPKTDIHDYDFKMRNATRFLSAGDKVKVTVIFRGREITHKEIAYERLQKVIKDLAEISNVEQPPRMDGRTMCMILAPKALKK
jgi:translation initiation factor IF-3